MVSHKVLHSWLLNRQNHPDPGRRLKPRKNQTPQLQLQLLHPSIVERMMHSKQNTLVLRAGPGFRKSFSAWQPGPCDWSEYISGPRSSRNKTPHGACRRLDAASNQSNLSIPLTFANPAPPFTCKRPPLCLCFQRLSPIHSLNQHDRWTPQDANSGSIAACSPLCSIYRSAPSF